MSNYFVELNSVDCSAKVEQKNGLSYLSWAWAWAEVKKRHPDAVYTIYENADGWFYHTDGNTCWVKTGVTVNGVEHIEYLPVMDYKNRSIPAANVTSFDVNKAVQRSLTKACARHGLGLYIYAGEDLPESADGYQSKSSKQAEEIKREQAILAGPIEEPHISVIHAAVEEGLLDADKMFAFYRVKAVEELTAKQGVEVCKQIEKNRSKR